MNYCWRATRQQLIRDEQDSVSVATSHNEIAVLEAVAENVTLPNQCTEEEATSLVPKEEPVQEVTNESIVEEVWQVVNENFLDARHNAWTADDWQVLAQCLPFTTHLVFTGYKRRLVNTFIVINMIFGE